MQTGADREVQRILLELLNQMDGFDRNDNVKVRRSRTVGLLWQACRPWFTCVRDDETRTEPPEHPRDTISTLNLFLRHGHWVH